MKHRILVCVILAAFLQHSAQGQKVPPTQNGEPEQVPDPVAEPGPDFNYGPDSGSQSPNEPVCPSDGCVERPDNIQGCEMSADGSCSHELHECETTCDKCQNGTGCHELPDMSPECNGCNCNDPVMAARCETTCDKCEDGEAVTWIPPFRYCRRTQRLEVMHKVLGEEYGWEMCGMPCHTVIPIDVGQCEYGCPWFLRRCIPTMWVSLKVKMICDNGKWVDGYFKSVINCDCRPFDWRFEIAEVPESSMDTDLC